MITHKKTGLTMGVALALAALASTAWETDKELRTLFNNSPAAFNATLTNYAQGASVDLSQSSTAAFVAPWTVTGRANGQYKRYDDASAFAIYDTARPIGGKRKRITFAADDPYYNCRPNGLEIPTDDFEVEQAGVQGDKFPLIQAKIRMLISAAYRSREKAVWDKVKAGKAATGGLGVWSNAAVSPIVQMNAEIKAITDETGIMPNRGVISLGAWAVITDHALVIARRAGVSAESVGLSDFAKMLLNPAMELRVGIIPYNTAGKGATKANANVMGSEVFVFIGQDSPDAIDPSFAKSFSTYGRGVDQVKTYREGDLLDIAAVDWSEDVIVTAPLSGRRITLS